MRHSRALALVTSLAIVGVIASSVAVGSAPIWLLRLGTQGPFDVTTGVSLHAGSLYVSVSSSNPFGSPVPSTVRKFDEAGNTIWSLPVVGDAGAVATMDTGLFVGGGGDFWLERRTLDGALLWRRTAGVGRVAAIQPTVDAVYAAGNAGFPQALLRRYDLAGTLIWSRSFSAGQVEIFDMAASADALYVVGFVSGALPGQTNLGYNDAFIRKYDLLGTELWTRQFGSPELDRADGVAVDATGVYVVGATPLPGEREGAAYLMRFDHDGNVLWARNYLIGERDAGYAHDAHAFDVVFDEVGVYVSGSFRGITPELPDGSTFVPYIRRFDRDGTVACTLIFPELGTLGFRIAGGHAALYQGGRADDPLPGGGADLQGYLARFNGDEPQARTAPTLTVSEGQTIVLDGSPSTDCDHDPLLFEWSVVEPASVPNPLTSPNSATPSFLALDDAVYRVRLTVRDDGDGASSADSIITVVNVEPSVTMIAPMAGALVAVGQPLALRGQFSDPGVLDAHTTTWTFTSSDQSIEVPGLVTATPSGGETSGSITFTSAGVYAVQHAVFDDDSVGVTTTVNDLEAFVVVYDPTGGFVTGGGSIDSPYGAYAPDPNLTGTASFGFFSKYQRGTDLPAGTVSFRLKVAGLDFASSSFDWLVVAGQRAKFRGRGTVNGAGDYAFLVSALDGDVSAHSTGDLLRVKIWDRATDVVLYDNQMGESELAEPSTLVEDGSIIVHK